MAICVQVGPIKGEKINDQSNVIYPFCFLLYTTSWSLLYTTLVAYNKDWR